MILNAIFCNLLWIFFALISISHNLLNSQSAVMSSAKYLANMKCFPMRTLLIRSMCVGSLKIEIESWIEWFWLPVTVNSVHYGCTIRRIVFLHTGYIDIDREYPYASWQAAGLTVLTHCEACYSSGLELSLERMFYPYRREIFLTLVSNQTLCLDSLRCLKKIFEWPTSSYCFRFELRVQLTEFNWILFCFNSKLLSFFVNIVFLMNEHVFFSPNFNEYKHNG